MKIKTSELSGTALDWAVAKAEGRTDIQAHPDGEISGQDEFEYETDWALAGPIIEREDISFRKYHNEKSKAHGRYYARLCRESGTMVCWDKTTGCQQTGPTPLIAAMRCYVASKLGAEIDIPEELV
jgi:hypothetical protein